MQFTRNKLKIKVNNLSSNKHFKDGVYWTIQTNK